MKTGYVKKGLVVWIIVLFIGAGVYPTIAINNIMSTNENTSDELVKIPVQMFGLNGVKSYKKSITKQQYNELQILKESFKEDFENADSMKESVKVYRDMVLSLNELGLLPDGISVKDVEKLVLGHYYYLDKLGVLSDKIIVDDPQQDTAGIYKNRFCQLTWASSNWWCYLRIPDFLIYDSMNWWLGIFMYRIAFGRDYRHAYEPPPESSIGWINARSSRQEWKYNGTFWGELDRDGGAYESVYYKGVHGFFGYSIDGYIFGYARIVCIETV